METEGKRMSISNKILDQAYAIFEEWGPNRSVDRTERLKQEFPALLDDEIQTLISEMNKISSTVWKIAKMGGGAKMSRSRIEKMLKEKHPFLNDKGLTHAVALVNYYAWHEGYDR